MFVGGRSDFIVDGLSPFCRRTFSILSAEPQPRCRINRVVPQQEVHFRGKLTSRGSLSTLVCVKIWGIHQKRFSSSSFPFQPKKVSPTKTCTPMCDRSWRRPSSASKRARSENTRHARARRSPGSRWRSRPATGWLGCFDFRDRVAIDWSQGNHPKIKGLVGCDTRFFFLLLSFFFFSWGNHSCHPQSQEKTRNAKERKPFASRGGAGGPMIPMRFERLRFKSDPRVGLAHAI